MDLQEAVKTGDRRTILVALREKLAREIDDCSYGRDVAALTKRLMDVCAELDALPDAEADANPLQKARKIYGS